MRIDGAHLTYCTNIHPGESWPEVRAALRRHLPAVKAQVAPDRPFGVGLRLAAAAAEALSAPEAREELRDLLAANGLYLFTINGFPYGAFHGVRVKEAVYRPDWRAEERLRYTDLLADLLAALLPDDPAVEGSISTVPGAFKPAVTSAADVERMAALLLRHAAHLAALRERTGRTLALALEPEPCCFLETVAETAAFFEEHLFGRAAVDRFAALAGLARGAAEEALRRHLGVCYDACHAAVEFEDAAASLDRLRRAGIRISKLQISAGLRVPRVDAAAVELLRPFAEGVYLHQVVERGPAGLTRYLDLPEALDGLAAGAGEREWRVHFHVPIFRDELGAFASTQFFLREILARHRADPVAPHLEVETYTWDVLPERYRGEPVETAIARELNWVRAQLGA